RAGAGGGGGGGRPLRGPPAVLRPRPPAGLLEVSLRPHKNLPAALGIRAERLLARGRDLRRALLSSALTQRAPDGARADVLEEGEEEKERAAASDPDGGEAGGRRPAVGPSAGGGGAPRRARGAGGRARRSAAR